MKNSTQSIPPTIISFPEQEHSERMIYNIRGIQVMLDRDLAFLYQVETKA